jgi:RHS repeat-associated protein
MQEYTYHPIEERILVKKTYNSTGTLIETVYYVNQNFVQVKNLSGTYNFTYIYNEGQLVAQLNPDGTKYYFVNDAKGDLVTTINSTGQVIDANQYSPTGEVLAGGNKSRYSYESKEYDKTIGWTDYNFRLYNPSAYIFGTPDSLIQNVYDGQSLNRYMFERGNPYARIDPTGHSDKITNQGSVNAYTNELYTQQTQTDNFFQRIIFAWGAGQLNTIHNTDQYYGDLTNQFFMQNPGSKFEVWTIKDGIAQVTYSQPSREFLDSWNKNVNLVEQTSYCTNCNVYVDNRGFGYSVAVSLESNMAKQKTQDQSGSNSGSGSDKKNTAKAPDPFNQPTPFTKPSTEYCQTHSDMACV